MPTVIDSLVLVFNLDASKFTEQQRDVLAKAKKLEEGAEKGAKATEEHTRRVMAGFTSLKREALGFLAAFVGGRGLKELFTHLTTVDASVGRLSKTLNMSTKDVSAWQGVAKQTGATAESMSGALQGMTDTINKWLVFGEPLPALFTALGISAKNANGSVKTAGELFLDLNRAVQGMDPARARAMLASLGLPADVINTLLLGERTLKNLLAEQKSIAEVSREDAAAAIELQNAWEKAEAAATSFARAIKTWLTPILIEALKGTTLFFQLLKEKGAVGMFKMIDESHPRGFAAAIGRAIRTRGERAAGPTIGKEMTNAGAAAPAEVEAYIRAAAAKRGIDPDQAVRVWESEGKSGYVGDRGSSFGPFQLHYGGIAGGGMSVKGLGDEFTRQTGLDARDPKTWQRQIDFSLDEVSRKGWGAWHGWKGAPWAGVNRPALGAPDAAAGRAGDAGSTTTTTSTTTVGTIVVNTQATDAEGIARDLRPAIERAGLASQANYGQQ